MISRLITFGTVFCFMITVLGALYFWQTGGLPFVSKPTPSQIVAERVETKKHKVTEADVACLSQEMWHGAGKGTGDRLEHILIGVAALNYRAATKKSLCVIFSQGLIMMPEHRKYTRSSVVVTPEANAGRTATQTSNMTEQLARDMLEKGVEVMLPPEKATLGCVMKFVRSYNGLLWMTVGAKPLEKLKIELTKELGEPRYSHPSGSVFFCPQ